MDQEKIGKFILKIRQDNNLSQTKFADRLNVTFQAVSKWENGRGIPDIEMLKKISEEFNVSIDEIIKGNKQTKKKNYILIIILLLIGICIYICFKNNSKLVVSSITSDKENFSITGVLAIVNNKTTIHISNITYNDLDNKKYLGIEAMLYEEIDNNYKIIAKYGNIENIKDNNTYLLKELLKDISFDIENYNDSCTNLDNHNLFITINAIDKEKNIIAYKIPLTLINNCNN